MGIGASLQLTKVASAIAPDASNTLLDYVSYPCVLAAPTCDRFSPRCEVFELRYGMDTGLITVPFGLRVSSSRRSQHRRLLRLQPNKCNRLAESRHFGGNSQTCYGRFPHRFRKSKMSMCFIKLKLSILCIGRASVDNLASEVHFLITSMRQYLLKSSRPRGRLSRASLDQHRRGGLHGPRQGSRRTALNK